MGKTLCTIIMKFGSDTLVMATMNCDEGLIMDGMRYKILKNQKNNLPYANCLYGFSNSGTVEIVDLGNINFVYSVRKFKSIGDLINNYDGSVLGSYPRSESKLFRHVWL